MTPSAGPPPAAGPDQRPPEQRFLLHAEKTLARMIQGSTRSPRLEISCGELVGDLVAAAHDREGNQAPVALNEPP